MSGNIPFETISIMRLISSWFDKVSPGAIEAGACLLVADSEESLSEPVGSLSWRLTRGDADMFFTKCASFASKLSSPGLACKGFSVRFDDIPRSASPEVVFPNSALKSCSGILYNLRSKLKFFVET